MIADDLAAASPVLRRFLDQAHIIRVPFSVYPWDDSDGRPGLLWADERIPKGLIPQDSEQRYSTEWARPPFFVVALVSQSAEKGLMLVLSADTPEKIRALAERLRPLDPNTAPLSTDEWLSRFMMLPDAIWEWSCFCLLLGMPIPGVIALSYFGAFHSGDGYARTSNITNLVYQARHRAVPDEKDMNAMRLEMLRLSLAQAIINGQPYDMPEHTAAAGAQITARTVVPVALDYLRNFEQASSSVVTAFALLGCRNIQTEVVIPAPRLQQSRQRKGLLPLYRYHILKVHSSMSGGKPSGKGEDIAVHWVRGHLKTYRDKGLFGKYPGRYWWSEHLAGTAPRYVEKEYELPE